MHQVMIGKKSAQDIFQLTNYVEKYDMVLNDFYLGRRDETILRKEKLEALLKIKDKKAEL